MVNETELLKMLMEKYPDQSPSFILEQFSVYKAGLVRVDSMLTSTESCVADAVCQTASGEAPAVPQKESMTAGFTKRNLKVKPEDAIAEDKIVCCLCGKEFASLTAKHIAAHNGLTREGYLKLCGYGPDTKLMSKKHLAKMTRQVEKAQKARQLNKAAQKATAENG